MRTKKAKTKMQKILYLDDGSAHPILAVDGKFYYCTDIQIRIKNGNIVRIEEQEVSDDEGSDPA